MLTSIPGSNASKSKMQKKGWKCWAKTVTHVGDQPKNGFDFEGQFFNVGAKADIEPGTLLLHHDDSHCTALGIVVPNSVGGGRIAWMESESSNWANILGGHASRLLKLTPEERINLGAQKILNEGELETDARPHYEALATSTLPPGKRSELSEEAAALVRQIQFLSPDQQALVVEAISLVGVKS